MCYHNIVPDTRVQKEGERMQGKKGKAAETLEEIDGCLDKVLTILAKLALVSMGIRTILEIWSIS